MSSKRNWVVVSDLNKTRIFQVEKNKHLSLKYTLKNEVDQRTKDHPEKGHVLSSTSHGHRALTNENSIHRKLIDPYVHFICDSLDKARKDHEFDHLMIVAGPEMLGHLRSHLDKNVQEVVSEEIVKDYSRFSMSDIEKSLEGRLNSNFSQLS